MAKKKKATRKKAPARKKTKAATTRPKAARTTQEAAALYRQAISSLEEARHEAALAASEQLVKLDPRARSFAVRGLSRRRVGDFQGALADLDHAVALEPDAPGARDARALLYFDLLRWEDARDELRRYLALPHTPLTDFLHLRLWLVRAQLREADADRELREHAARVAASSEPARAWWGTLAGHLLGDVRLADLRSPTSTAEQRCEAAFFAGARAFALGDRSTARYQLERCIGQGVTAFTEHHSAVVLEAALSPHPKRLLQRLPWIFDATAYPSARAFGEAVAKYQRDMERKDVDWRPDAVVLAAPEVVVSACVWEGKEQVDLLHPLRSADPAGFTAAELLWRIHAALAGKELGDHRFFEGLTLSRDDPLTYTLRCGS